MPSLVRVPFAYGLDTLIWRAPPNIAVSTNGRVAVPGDFGTRSDVKHWLQIVDRSAMEFLSVGRSGKGPGEMSGADFAYSVGSEFRVYDLGSRALIQLSDRGSYLGEHRPEFGERLILAVGSDSVDVVAMRWKTAGTQPLVTRVPIKGGSGRVLASTSNAFVLRALQRPNRAGAAVLDLPYAALPGRFAVGDPVAYRIEVYDDAGKLRYTIKRDAPREYRDAADVAAVRKSLEFGIKEVAGRPDLARPLKARLDTLEREALPHFTRSGMWFDGAGRLWVIGGRGDSTFADTFADARFLGRQMLPCTKPKRLIALQGEWLALICETPSHEEAPVRLLLYSFGPQRSPRQ